MSYTHSAIAQPGLTSGHLLLREGWNRFYLVGTIRTEQAAIFVFESENPIDLAWSMELFDTAPEVDFIQIF